MYKNANTRQSFNVAAFKRRATCVDTTASFLHIAINSCLKNLYLFKLNPYKSEI